MTEQTFNPRDNEQWPNDTIDAETTSEELDDSEVDDLIYQLKHSHLAPPATPATPAKETK